MGKKTFIESTRRGMHRSRSRRRIPRPPPRHQGAVRVARGAHDSFSLPGPVLGAHAWGKGSNQTYGSHGGQWLGPKRPS
eukprot:4467230-Pyramimonas_sp.AAC.1